MTTYTGDNSNNTINGGNGADVISGGGGEDNLSGGNGNDVISGGSEDDTIDGGNANDILSGDAGDDIILGVNGNDILNGGADDDYLSGGNGDDSLTGGGDDDILEGGNGFDTAYFSGNISEYVLFYSGGFLHVVHQGGAGADGHDQLKTVERLVFADRIIDLTGSGNHAPIAGDDHVFINEDSGTFSSGAGKVTDNDFDVEGSPLTVTNPGTYVGTYGTLTLNANGTYSYTLNAGAQALAQGANVTDSFNYTVSDGSATDTGAVVIHIAGLNDAPVANADTASAGENQTILVNVLTNDTDVDNGAVLTVTTASAPAGQGTASVVGNQVQWNPGTDFDHLAVGATASVTVSYSIQDEHGATSSSSINITVTGTNDGPVANPDTASTSENASVLVDVLVNDTDADDGHVLTVTAASAPAGQGTASVVSNQVQWNPGTDFDHLAVGATATVVVSYSIQDEHGATSSSTVSIIVTGTNDGPVANPDTASAGENQTILVNVLTNDTDVDDGAVLTVTAASAPAGQGTASVVGNQVQWNPGTDFDHLAVGATATVLVNYSIQDQFGATSSSTVNITVTGTNDGPVANADTDSTSENVTVLIDVLTNDTDVDDGAVLTVTAATAPVGQGTASVVGNQVEFDPGTDFDYLAVGESVVVNVSYSIEDEHGASASSTIAVTVTGTNDAPTIDAGGTTATGTVTELPDGDPGENSFVHTASGSVAFDDADVSDTHSASFTPDAGGYVGTFTLDPVDQLGDTVGWDFNVSDADIDFLDEGETLVQTYTIEIDDGHGGTATQDVTVTITGESDNLPPDAVNDSYDAIGNVTLTVPAGTGVLANDTDDAGVGTGPGQANVTAYDSTSANGGSVTMNPDGSFTYISAPGFQGTDTFTYTLTDAESESDVATVTISVDQPVWFIDNAAVGSANTGTQEDPFTSIASFNAAQGTANGPAPGETVYLRFGTGTYAEADGINLTNGQTLTGGGDDLIVGGDTIETGTGRPVISVTGSGNNAVDAAQNNTLSGGFDIGSTVGTGAGIADSGGTVGTLTVADVGIGGVRTGQIVDIDQGGTLNVQLNSAATTSSSTNAIDLNALSGSFTVSGATAISGVTAAGVDVTASTGLSVTFGGNFVSSTGLFDGINFATNSNSSLNLTGGLKDIDGTGAAADGILFTTNTGSSALNITGGGLDIDVLAGRGLAATGGGSILISGSGNSITNTTGTNVNLTNVSSGGVTLESVSSAGGNSIGIILDNAGSGGFTVTGIGSVAGSGGTINGKNGTDGLLTQGIGVYVNNTSNVSLSNMTITNTQNYGVLGTNAQNFSLHDSSVTGNHGTNAGIGESALNFVNLTGTALFEGNVVSGGRFDNLRIVNSTGSLDLDIRDSASDQAVFGLVNAAGDDSVLVQTSSSATLDMLVDGVSFLGARGDLLQTSAQGSSIQDIIITDSSFTNTQVGSAGGGVTISGGGAGSNINVDYQVIDSTFTGAISTALRAAFNQQAGDVRGYISGNTIGVNDGLSTNVGSFSGDGISVGLDKAAGTGDASYTATIVDNAVYDVRQGSGGISVFANGGNGTNDSVVEAHLDGNTVAEQGDFALAAFYAEVGGGSGVDNSRLGLEISNNTFDNSGADFGANAMFFDQVDPVALFYFPGYAGSGDGEGLGGTAGADLSAFLVGQGNTMVNGAVLLQPGFVYADFLNDATGAALTHPVWFP